MTCARPAHVTQRQQQERDILYPKRVLKNIVWRSVYRIQSTFFRELKDYLKCTKYRKTKVLGRVHVLHAFKLICTNSRTVKCVGYV